MKILWDYWQLAPDGEYTIKSAWQNLINSVLNRQNEINMLYSQGITRPLDLLVDQELAKFNAVYEKNNTTIVYFADDDALTHFLMVWS